MWDKAPGLTLRAVLEKFGRMQMLDVHFPTTDDRELIFTRHTQPETDQQLLLEILGWTLPAQNRTFQNYRPDMDAEVTLEQPQNRLGTVAALRLQSRDSPHLFRNVIETVRPANLDTTGAEGCSGSSRHTLLLPSFHQS